MIKRLFSLLLMTMFLVSCGNSGKKETSATTGNPDEALKVEFTSLVNNPSEYIGKNISVEGKVVHVCTQSGKKLFVTGEDPNVMLYVQAGEEMPKFPMELLGSEITVEGTLTQVSSAGEMMGEGMHQGEGMHKGEGIAETPGADTCTTSKALSSQVALADLMMVYNKHTVVK